jgi:hypothetical protein
VIGGITNGLMLTTNAAKFRLGWLPGVWGWVRSKKGSKTLVLTAFYYKEM